MTTEQTIGPCPACGIGEYYEHDGWRFCNACGFSARCATWDRLSDQAARIVELEAHITIDNGLLNRTRLLLSDLLQGMRPLPTTYMRELQTDIEAWRTGRFPK